MWSGGIVFELSKSTPGFVPWFVLFCFFFINEWQFRNYLFVLLLGFCRACNFFCGRLRFSSKNLQFLWVLIVVYQNSKLQIYQYSSVLNIKIVKSKHFFVLLHLTIRCIKNCHGQELNSPESQTSSPRFRTEKQRLKRARKVVNCLQTQSKGKKKTFGICQRASAQVRL